jgi:ankyrin repeat protein
MDNLPVVQYLIKHDADIHEYEGEALELAVRNGHLSVVKCLIKHGLGFMSLVLMMLILKI